MPRIVSGGVGKWALATVEGLSAEDWSTLGSFEEWIPEDDEVPEKTTAENGEKKTKKKKKKTKEEIKVDEDEEEMMEEEEKEEESLEEEKMEEEKNEKGKKRKKNKKDHKVKEKKMRMEDGEAEDEMIENEIEEKEVDVSKWIELCVPSEIAKNIGQMGFDTPTEIQQRVLPSAVRDRLDILGAAETGSGKTLAYVVPLIVRLIEEERVGMGPRAIVLAPTRELVIQVRKHVDALIKDTGLRAASIVGGLSQQKQERILKYRPEILVASPGRLWALMHIAESNSYLNDWTGLRCVVIDETDRMVEKGHFVEMENIMGRIKREREGNDQMTVQTLVFSATLTFCHLSTRKDMPEMKTEFKISKLVSMTGLRKERKVFDLTRSVGTATTLTESRLNCDGLLGKDSSLVYLIHRYSGRSIVFCNSVDASRRLYGILSKLKIPVLLLHAKMQQRARLKNLDRFSQRQDSVLLATDVAARGLDIKGIDHVFHYQVPKTAELYIHRSGRTARASHHGLSILLVDQTEAGFYRRICTNLNRSSDLPVFPIDCDALFRELKERVRVASELDTTEHNLKKKSQRESWFEKAALELDMDLDDRKVESSGTQAEMFQLVQKEKRLQGHLKALLAQPLSHVDRANMPRTRYITAQMAKDSEEKATTQAIETAQQSVHQLPAMKKKARALLTTRNVTLNKKKHKKGKK